MSQATDIKPHKESGVWFKIGPNPNLTFDPNKYGQIWSQNGPLVSKVNTGELTLVVIPLCHKQAAATRHPPEP